MTGLIGTKRCEPKAWQVQHVKGNRVQIVDHTGSGALVCVISEYVGREDTQLKYANRIVDCVNAFLGMENPKAETHKPLTKKEER